MTKTQMSKVIDKIMSKIALPVIVAAGALLVGVIFADTRGTTTQNNAYVRVINCIVSYPATRRTQEDIERCYTTVESDLDIELQRYDSSARR